MKEITTEFYVKRRQELLHELKQLDHDFFKQFSFEPYMINFTAVTTEATKKISRGIPSKESYVVDWRIKHPNGTPKQCCLETDIGMPTIEKWWHSADKYLLKKATKE